MENKAVNSASDKKEEIVTTDNKSLCRRCNVNINKGNSHCPLCGSYIQKAEANNLSYPQGLREKTITGNVLGFFISLSVLAVLVCGVTDYIISKRLIWSVYVFGGIALSWLVMILPIARKWSFRRMLAVDVITISLFIILLGILTDGLFWSFRIVVPMLIGGSVVTLAIVMLCNKRIAKGFGFVLSINCLLGFFPIIINSIFFSSGSPIEFWPSLSCFVACAIILVIYIMCNWKNIKAGFKKVFHIKGY